MTSDTPYALLAQTARPTATRRQQRKLCKQRRELLAASISPSKGKHTTERPDTEHFCVLVQALCALARAEHSAEQQAAADLIQAAIRFAESADASSEPHDEERKIIHVAATSSTSSSVSSSSADDDEKVKHRKCVETHAEDDGGKYSDASFEDEESNGALSPAKKTYADKSVSVQSRV